MDEFDTDKTGDKGLDFDEFRAMLLNLSEGKYDEAGKPSNETSAVTAPAINTDQLKDHIKGLKDQVAKKDD